jgi:succinate-semialdehyde dehydrogenase/glutarate-semialdehyde dehydrogenase
MKMIIGGRKVDSSDGKTINSINPYTLKTIDVFPSATPEDIDQALGNAVRGLKEWEQVPLHKRIDILNCFIQKISERQGEIATLLTKEMGKPIKQARGEAGSIAERTLSFIEGARQLGGHSYPPANWPSSEGDLIITIRQALGVVVAISPFNFPVADMMTKVVASLIMGNAVIAKPASATSLCSIRVVELLLESGVPGNVLQIVTGPGGKIGDLLTGDSRVAAVTMTGSTEAGARIASQAVRNISHVTLELGGNDALVVLPDADLELAVRESAANRIRNSGQACCATKRYIVPNNLKERFIQMLSEKLKKFKLGDPLSEDTDCGPLVSVEAAKEVERAIQHTVKQEGKVVLGGKRLNESFIEPTILDVSPDADVAKSLEVFGPVWTVIGYDSTEQALEIANNSDYGLNSGVIGKDLKQLLYFAKSMQAGTCVINGSSYYVGMDSPFGGYKKSGLGRESTLDSLMEMSQEKTIVFKQCY